MDSSIPPQDIDLNSADWLGDSEVPYTLVFTKVRDWVCIIQLGVHPFINTSQSHHQPQYDKKKKRAPSPDDNIDAFMKALAQKWETLPPALVTSASTGYGKVDLLRYIASMRMRFEAMALTDALK